MKSKPIEDTIKDIKGFFKNHEELAMKSAYIFLLVSIVTIGVSTLSFLFRKGCGEKIGTIYLKSGQQIDCQYIKSCDDYFWNYDYLRVKKVDDNKILKLIETEIDSLFIHETECSGEVDPSYLDFKVRKSY